MPLLSATSMTFPVSTRRPVDCGGVPERVDHVVRRRAEGRVVDLAGVERPGLVGAGTALRGLRLAVAVPVAGRRQVVGEAQLLRCAASDVPVELVAVGAGGDPGLHRGAVERAVGGDGQDAVLPRPVGDAGRVLPGAVGRGEAQGAGVAGGGGEHGLPGAARGQGEFVGGHVEGVAGGVGGGRHGDRDGVRGAGHLRTGGGGGRGRGGGAGEGRHQHGGGQCGSEQQAAGTAQSGVHSCPPVGQDGGSGAAVRGAGGVRSARSRRSAVPARAAVCLILRADARFEAISHMLLRESPPVNMRGTRRPECPEGCRGAAVVPGGGRSRDPPTGLGGPGNRS